MKAPELYGPEHADYRESVRTFLRREVTGAYPRWAAERAIPREVLTVAGAHGFLGMRVPEALGGPGVEDPRFGAIVAQEAMAAGAPALALVLAAHNDVALPALLRADPSPESEWLDGCASGERIAAVVNRDVAITPTSASEGTLLGDAHYVVGGALADVFVVRGVSETGPALGVVGRDAPGVEILPSDPPVGLGAAGFATVRFDAAPVRPLAGSPPDALQIDDALAHAVTALAGARRALDVTRRYVTERTAFGQPIAGFQNTRRALAGLAGQADVAAAFLEHALRRQVAGRLDLATAAAAKLSCTELYARAVDAGVQFHGGYGYIMEYEIAHAFADARFWRLSGGADAELLDAMATPLFT